VEALSIDPNSESAQRLLKYRTPTRDQPNSGDFGTAVYLALIDRARKDSSLTIAQLNNYLDQLLVAPDTVARKRVLTQLLHESTALMQKWIVRIILKDLKLGSGEKLFLGFLHPDAISLFTVTTNLQKVCEQLVDPMVRQADKMVQLFSYVKSMLASQVAPNDVLKAMDGEEFVIETKFDGNRFQVHRSGDMFQFFSRKGLAHDGYHNFESLFKECIRGDQWIIDGEMMALTAEGTFGPFKDVRSMQAGTMEDELLFIIFDVLMINGTSLIKEALRERIGVLKQIVTDIPKRVELVKRQVATTLQEVEAAVDMAIANHEEGIMVEFFFFFFFLFFLWFI
jgi:DNA ligase-4